MGNKYLLQDIVDALAISENLKKKDAEDFIRAYFGIIEDGLLRDNFVKINDLGTFRLILAEARSSVDVNTGKSFLIKEHFKLNFISDPKLRNQINKPFAGFEPVETEIIKTQTQKISKPQTEPEKNEINSPHDFEPQMKKSYIESKSNNKSYELSENSVIPDNLSDAPELIHKKINYESNLKNEKKSYSKDNKSGKRVFWIFLIIVIAVAAFWVIKSNNDAIKETKIKNKVFEKFMYDTTQQVVITDTVPQIEEDTLITQIEKILATKTIEEKFAYPLSITIKSGDGLMKMSEKYYGHKAFWVYIYLENKNVLESPNDIPVGKTIRISKPDSTRMNPNNPECLRKAERIQYQLLAE